MLKDKINGDFEDNVSKLSENQLRKLESCVNYFANVKHWLREQDIDVVNPDFSKIREIIYQDIFKSEKSAENFFSDGYKIYETNLSRCA